MDIVGKDFISVFPRLRTEGELEELLKTIQVARVSVNKARDLLRVYVVSSQWIHKKYIYKLEEEIAGQLFSDTPLRVKIIEKFYLSRQYTPEKLLDVYRSSILLELKNYNILLFHLFQTARITFPTENSMTLTLKESVIAHEKEEELYRILEKIFNERCGLPLQIQIAFYQP